MPAPGQEEAGIDVKFDKGATVGSELVDKGNHDCVITDVEEKEGQESGKPYLAWTLTIFKGDFKGRKLWYNTTLQSQDGKNFALFGFLEAVGYPGIKRGKAQNVNLKLSKILGKVIKAKVGHRDYEGEPRANVLSVSESSTEAPKDDTPF